jgi:hypothetical protein
MDTDDSESTYNDQATAGDEVETLERNQTSLSKRTRLDENLPPLHDITEIFADLTSKAIEGGFSKALDHLGNRPLRVATMCSGTESPLLALGLIKDCKLLPDPRFYIDMA